jgi:hypothetical protein
VAAYEALATVGLPVGFVTDATLKTPEGCSSALLNGSRPASGFLLIPETSFVADATADCVQNYVARGGGLAVIGALATAGGTALRFDERGHARSDASLAWLDAAPHIPLDAAAAMFSTIEAAALPFVSRSVRCVDAVTGSTAFGVWCRVTSCSSDGTLSHDGELPLWLRPPALPKCTALLFLVNTRVEGAAMTIEVDGSAASAAWSLLTNSSVVIGTAGLILPPLGVQLLML